MERVSYMHTSFVITLTVLFAVFEVMNSGCNTEPVITEPILETESSSETLAPDLSPTVDIGTNEDMTSEPIEVVVGETFVFSLESNPTTGYMWHPEFDSEFLKLLNRTFIVTSPEVTGGSGIETFEFAALKQGQVLITMIYKRSWEDQHINKRSKQVNIVIPAR